jgi:hypothetical protein
LVVLIDFKIRATKNCLVEAIVLNKRIIIVLVVMLSVLAVIPIFHLPIVKAINETASIQGADASINQAFTNVLAAEKAGGNVTQLLAKLNTAGALLAEAENDYKAGNLNNVASVADNARLIANQVNSDAIGLRNSSITQSQNNSLFTVLFSIISTITFIAVVLLIWRRVKTGFNRKY